MKSIWSLTVVELTIMQSRIPHKRIISSTEKFDESRDNVKKWKSNADCYVKNELTYSEGVIPPITLA